MGEETFKLPPDLIVVFRKDAALGMVRLIIKQTIAKIHPILTKKGTENIAMYQTMDERFHELLGEELDRVFKEVSPSKIQHE